MINNDKKHIIRRLVFVIVNNILCNCYGVMNEFKLLSKIEDSNEFGQCLFLTISYLSDLHKNKKLFHGDIKPMNIFYSIKHSHISSDSGSIIPLYDDQEYF